MLDFRKYINEAPLSNFDTSDISPENRNNKVTAPLFKSDVAGKLKKILDRTRWDFNIEFKNVDFRNVGFPLLDINDMKKSNKNNSIKIVFTKDFYSTPETKKAIGDAVGFFGLSPWMLLHRIGHLVSEHSRNLHDYIKDIHDKTYDHKEPYSTDYKVLKYFAFKTAVNKGEMDYLIGQFQLGGEFSNELVAEYLWHGGNIRLINNPPQYIIDNVEKIKQEIAKTLDNMMGKIFYV